VGTGAGSGTGKVVVPPQAVRVRVTATMNVMREGFIARVLKGWREVRS
jgi:hypothetical protein